jgi:hypothetical protein
MINYIILPEPEELLMTLINAEFLRKIERLEPDLKDVIYPMVEVLEKPHEEGAGKIEFNELKNIVADLGEAQIRTEKRLEELVGAQIRTEKRLEELTEAQKRTEKRVEELVGAQKRTEKSLEELTTVVKGLVDSQQKMREELGGLGMTVGYTLENEAFKKLPALLTKDFGIQVKQGFKRTYVRDIEGKAMEVNIFGYGEKDGKEVTIIGESKAQLSKKKVNDFIQENSRRLQGVYPEIFLVLITHMITAPGVDEYVKKKGIALYYSYDF